MATSLSDKIAGILNVAPNSFDPEDDIHEETTARVVAHGLEEDSEDEIIGKLRKQNVDHLEDVDTRYKGKRASRKKLGREEWSSDDDINGSEQETLEPQDDGEESGDEDSDISEEDGEDGESDGNIISGSESEKEDSFKHIEEPEASVQIEKGQCVRQQLSMWENLLEMRIQLQKCLIAANKLPSSEVDVKKEHSAKFAETRKSLTNLLNKLLYLQLLLLRKYPETKSLLSGASQAHEKASDDNEEIPSDTEDEQNASEEELPMKRQKLNYKSELGKRHESYRNYRDGVIKKWNDKTRIASNKSGNVLHSVLKQIEHVLSDKEKLVKRSQLCRMDYSNNNVKAQEQIDINEVYNPEIFDDTDFYHQLLRELIEYKSADLTDPVQLGRQWIQLQNLRSKMKRKIDTRATKGRKIRYAVHSKLVNFMAPRDDMSWQNEAKTELYNSLFGKCQITNKL